MSERRNLWDKRVGGKNENDTDGNVKGEMHWIENKYS